MPTPINTILSWFQTGDFPTQEQFAESWKSFYHKEENIPVDKVENLNAELQNKADASVFETHLTNENSHNATLAKLDASNLNEENTQAWKTALGVTTTTLNPASNYLVYWDGNDFTASGVYYDGTKYGIGTTAPGEMFHLNNGRLRAKAMVFDENIETLPQQITYNSNRFYGTDLTGSARTFMFKDFIDYKSLWEGFTNAQKINLQFDFNYLETNVWYDGTAMADARVDNNIFIKKDNKYFQKTISKDILLKVGTIAELRQTNAYYEGQEVLLLGYYESGDKNPVTYKFTVQDYDTAIDDGGLTIKTDRGVWVAHFDGVANVKDFGVKGDGVTDDTHRNQKAVDFCIKYGLTLYYPKGTYIFSYTNKQSHYISPFDLSSSTESEKDIKIIGEGSKKTIFKLADGQVDLAGRYTQFIRYYANKDGKKTSKIVLQGFALDMNARSNNFPLVAVNGFFAYEQSHALIFNGHTTFGENIELVDIDDVEIIDKVGGGIVFGTAPNFKINRLNINDIYSINHTKFPNSINTSPLVIGMRGDIELGGSIGATYISSSTMQYTQIEPVTASSSTLQRNTNISDVIVDKFEFTDSGGFSFINVSRLKSKSFLVRGVQGQFTDSVITFDGGVSNGNLKFSKCNILIKYDSTSNSLIPAQFGIVAGATENYTFEFELCQFTIDNSDTSLTPTGFMLRGNGATSTTDAQRFKYYLYGCTFDKRAEKNIEAYAHGIWKIVNTNFACRTNAIFTGAYSTYYASVEVVDCNFDDVIGRPINIQASVLTFYLKVVGVYDLKGKAFFERTAGTAFIPNTVVPNSAVFISDMPVTNMFMPYNQFIIKKDATGGQIGWRQNSLTNTQNWREVYEFTKIPAQEHSTAANVADIVNDFNTLLDKLKSAGIFTS
jgi:Pectate lyase superfamily protein